MKRMIRIATMAVAALWACVDPTYAQTKSTDVFPVFVDVEYDSGNSVAGRLAYEIKEKLRASHGMKLVYSADEGRIRLSVVAVASDNEGGSRATAYSAVWILKTWHQDPLDVFETQLVGIVGIDKVEAVAAKLVANTDSVVTKWRELMARSEAASKADNP